jgi:hypothetical protein
MLLSATAVPIPASPRPSPIGSPNHKVAVLNASTIDRTKIHGLRRPPASAIAPRNGASKATPNPA